MVAYTAKGFRIFTLRRTNVLIAGIIWKWSYNHDDVVDGDDDDDDDGNNNTIRGVARNLLRGDKRGDLGDRSPPTGSRGRAPVGVWAPEAREKC